MMQGKTPSLPMCGAWIEIRQVRINHMPHYVAPYVGSVD